MTRDPYRWSPLAKRGLDLPTERFGALGRKLRPQGYVDLILMSRNRSPSPVHCKAVFSLLGFVRRRPSTLLMLVHMEHAMA